LVKFFQGLPVIAVGVGLSTYDKASVRIIHHFYRIFAVGVGHCCLDREFYEHSSFL